MWLPSQNGLFSDLPHLQRVTRFLISYSLPFADSIGMPPRTQSGPCSPLGGYSITTMDLSNLGSIVFPLSLSVITSRPEGQLHASSIAMSRASWFSDCVTRFQIPPARMQNLAWTQRCSLSANVSAGPRITFAVLSKGTWSPASVPSKEIFA